MRQNGKISSDVLKKPMINRSFAHNLTRRRAIIWKVGCLTSAKQMVDLNPVLGTNYSRSSTNAMRSITKITTNKTTKRMDLNLLRQCMGHMMHKSTPYKMNYKHGGTIPLVTRLCRSSDQIYVIKDGQLVFFLAEVCLTLLPPLEVDLKPICGVKSIALERACGRGLRILQSVVYGVQTWSARNG